MSIVPRQLVALAYVANVRASADFYARLGFEVGNTHADPGSGEVVWAALARRDCPSARWPFPSIARRASSASSIPTATC